MRKYGLIGHPLGHSFSRGFHNARFRHEGIAAIYENFDLENIAQLPQVLAAEPDLAGFNVTIPYKQSVMDYLDYLDPKAAAIGAVNVVRVIRADGDTAARVRPNFSTTTVGACGVAGIRLEGYNSDCVGFADSIRPMIDAARAAAATDSTRYEHALVLGTGGGSRAVCYALREMGVEPQYVSRHDAPGVLTYDDLTPALVASYGIIVNCSPVGMFPHVDECPAIPYAALTPAHICFDLIYNPEETLFMRRAAAQGAATRNGQDMLVGQALEAWRIWTDGEG